MNRKNTLILLAAGFILALTLGALSGCGVPPELPTPTLISQLPATATPTPEPTATPTSTPTVTPTPRPTNTPTPVAKATKAAASAAAAPAKSKTATPATVVIVVTEAEANKMAQEGLAQQKDVQIDNPKVDFRPDEMYVSGDVKIGFFKLNVGILATVEPVNGKPEVTIEEIFVNGDPATGFIRDQIEAMIAPHLDQLAMVSDDFYVEDIVITDDEMVITGHYR
jgi:hypothetical protein